LKPSKKRHHLAHVTLSIEPVLLNRTHVAFEPLIENQETNTDGLGAFLLRMGPGMKAAGPDPRGTGGQYYLVMNGLLERDGEHYPAWSTLFVDAADPPLAVTAGAQGLEALILQYSRLDS